MVSNETAATDKNPDTGEEKAEGLSDPEGSAGEEASDATELSYPKPDEPKEEDSPVTVIKTKKIPSSLPRPKSTDGATSTSSVPSINNAESFVTAQPTTATPVIFKSKKCLDPEPSELQPYISAKETKPAEPEPSDEATDEEGKLGKIKDWGHRTFDWNVDFLLSVRGLLLVVQLICSLLVVCLLTASCKFLLEIGESVDGFYCRHIDHFHFNVALVSFSIAAILLAGCLFSKDSDAYIYHSVFEILFYVIFCFFFLISSLLLLSNVKSRNKDRPNEFKYGHIFAASITGLVCCGVHGANLILKTTDYAICCFKPPIRMPVYPLSIQNVYQRTSLFGPPPYNRAYQQGHPYAPPPYTLRYTTKELDPTRSRTVPPPSYQPR